MKAWIEGFAQLEIYFLKVGRHQVEKRYTHKVLVRGQTGGVVIYSVCFGITGLGISESVLGGCLCHRTRLRRGIVKRAGGG